MTKRTYSHPRKPNTLNRRAFLGRTAAAAGSLAFPTLIPASALGADGHVAPSNRINLAQIGLGVMGPGHVRRLAYDRGVSLLAICDVDRQIAEKAKAYLEGTTPDAIRSDTAFRDEMLKQAEGYVADLLKLVTVEDVPRTFTFEEDEDDE